MFRRILVPLDGSAESYAALPLTRTVARATGASVTLVRVLTPEEDPSEVGTQLERVARELENSDINVQARIRAGKPADQILAAVEAEGADLVVMRTHGRSGFTRALLGSVAQYIVARSPVPVLLLRAGGRRISALRKILVPVDGFTDGTLAVETALGIARSAQADVHLVQVVVPMQGYLAGSMGWDSGVAIDEAWDAERTDAARKYLASVAARVQDVPVTHKVHVAPEVAVELVTAADSLPADLIVMSTHALTGASRAVLGSVADVVIRAAHCPVLVIRVSDPAEPVHATKPLIAGTAADPTRV